MHSGDIIDFDKYKETTISSCRFFMTFDLCTKSTFNALHQRVQASYSVWCMVSMCCCSCTYCCSSWALLCGALYSSSIQNLEEIPYEHLTFSYNLLVQYIKRKKVINVLTKFEQNIILYVRMCCDQKGML